MMKERQTRQKQLIYEIIQGNGNHMTVEEVKAKLDALESGVGLATVYRNLNKLASGGLIRKFVEDNKTVFDGNPEPHDHFRCIRCGKTIDLGDLPYEPEIDYAKNKQIGGKILCHTTVFEGICEDCLLEEDTNNGIKGIENREEFE